MAEKAWLLDFVIHVENTLGWVPEVSDKKPLWKVRAIEAGRIKKAVEKDPHRLTRHNLELAVEYLRRKRQPVKSPYGVIYYVDRALEMSNSEPVVSDLAAEIAAAKQREFTEAKEGWEYWVGRFVRAEGSGRLAVLNEWRAAGRDG